VDTLSEPLSRFVSSLGKKPYCTDDFSYGLKIRSKKKALEHDYISLNQRLRRYLVLDIDYKAAALAWEDIGLAPTITVINKENAHAHLMYELSSPVSFSDRARSKPQAYFKAVEHSLATALKADISYSGLITKNPLSDLWLVDYNNGRFDLEELAEYCPTLSPGRARALKADPGEGRNCSLFNDVRLWAYFQVKEFVIYEAWYQTVLARCEQANIFTPALPYSEVRATAKSIAKWTWKYRHDLGNRKNRGAAKVDKRLNLTNRQKAGAAYTNQNRKEQTEKAIVDAVSKLTGQGKALTVAELMRMADVSRRTLYNYNHLWKQ